MKILIMTAAAAVGIVAVVIGVGQLGLLSGPAPGQLGVVNGRLKPPSINPNSVSSQASLYPEHPQLSYAAIAPLKFKGGGAVAMARLASLLQDSGRTEIVTRRPDYIYAQCSTALLKFTDDVEFWLDESSGVIEFRSASRLGRKDFGTNRARMEAIRARFAT